MAYDVLVTPMAAQDLDEIVQYVLLELQNPTASADFLDCVEECYKSLTFMPERYEYCKDPQLKSLGYRRVAIKNYIMVYRVDKEAETVIVLRLFYGRRDYESLI